MLHVRLNLCGLPSQFKNFVAEKSCRLGKWLFSESHMSRKQKKCFLINVFVEQFS
jgi:hypothetical protein